MSYELIHNTSRRAPKLTTPAIAQAYRKLPKEGEVAERGDCHDAGGTDENGQQVFNCDACGCVLSLYHRDGTNTMCTHFIYDYPRYCPACRRRVVD
jgi:hypothetical protein